ncbi:MAG TPA: DNA-directed RNA polymerase subunit beta' [Candidatus Fraserbacteria bacterium]|nr:DNA-directed RNA polymerase subunit beta' [Candidatus Fraserbacteria bacterium]
MIHGDDIAKIKIGLASPEEIRNWSQGEVVESETINYRTYKPERGGLYAEEIFGPENDYECSCGKYRGRKYEGLTCEKCGVLVTTRDVRRTNMGHIELASPVIHFWFLQGLSSPLGILLGIKRNVLKKIAYYETEPLPEELYLVTSSEDEGFTPGELLYLSQYDILSQAKRFKAELAYELAGPLELRAQAAGTVELSEMPLENGETVLRLHLGDQDYLLTSQAKLAVEVGSTVEQGELLAASPLGAEELISETVYRLLQSVYPDLRANAVRENVDSLIYLVTSVQDSSLPFKVGDQIWEPEKQAYERLFPRQFEAATGSKGVRRVLAALDLEALSRELQSRIAVETALSQRKRLLKRLEVVEELRRSGNRPENMVLTVIPVLPPELRPIVKLEGGKFATTDLNDLYRRIINRNNRLKKLRDMGAPEVILRNERRMLQEAVDALIYNEKKDNSILGRDNRPLKSLSDRIQGKHGRLRRNLLGKRVDYSGRAVIVVNPHLKLGQCGIPKKMALELFKPFILRGLGTTLISNYDEVKNKALSGEMPQVWDVLETLIKDHPVLLNRAPTLHRLGIQAFKPVLVGGEAIQIHPWVCTPYNADFDGDQMAVHLPLSPAAINEANQIMLAPLNIISPSNGEPLTVPTKDAIFAFYYLTLVNEQGCGAGKAFANLAEAERAYDEQIIDLHAPITLRLEGRLLQTTLGRVKLNQLFPEDLRDYQRVFNSSAIKKLIMQCYRRHGNDRTVQLLDDLKDLGFFYATQSGLTISVTDCLVPPEKPQILQKAYQRVARINEGYQQGFVTDDKRKLLVIKEWMRTVDEVEAATMANFAGHPFNPIQLVVSSGARGSANQVKQLAGMRGPMIDPTGRILEMPVVSNFREGLDAMEYFISTHGGRKGTADTALKTANSGYLTRRLVDAAEELIVKEEDCGSSAGIPIDPLRYGRDEPMEPIEERLYGRVAAQTVHFGGEVILEANQLIELELAHRLGTLELELSPQDPDFLALVTGTKGVNDLRDPQTNRVLVSQDELIGPYLAEQLAASSLKQVTVRPNLVIRSPMTCQTRRGVCRHCYGLDLSRHQLVELGTAVGVIAAQSIGEPGTQLTLRTFHTGGVVGEDITQGLPRAEELFEARKALKSTQAEIAEIKGIVTKLDLTPEGQERVNIRGGSRSILVPTALCQVKPGDQVDPKTIIRTKSPAAGELRILEEEGRRRAFILGENDHIYLLPPGVAPTVRPGDWVEVGTPLSEPFNEEAALARSEGVVSEIVENGERYIVVESPAEDPQRYPIPYGARKQVEVGQQVKAGMKLSTRSTRMALKAERPGQLIVGPGLVIVYQPSETGEQRFYPLSEDINILKENGARLTTKTPLFSLNLSLQGTAVIEAVEEQPGGLTAITLHYESQVVLATKVIVGEGDKVQEGDLLSKGVISPHRLLQIAGVGVTRDYLLTEIHKVYKSQGVDINDKHLELIIRQMLNNVRIEDPGDGQLFPNQLVIVEEFRQELQRLTSENEEIKRQQAELIGRTLAEPLLVEDRLLAPAGTRLSARLLQQAQEVGLSELKLGSSAAEAETVRIREKRLPVGERVLLRISKSALETKSWLSAASFQRTTTVLSDAALKGLEDPLEGLKPNVIVSKKIPCGTGFRRPSAPQAAAEGTAESQPA